MYIAFHVSNHTFIITTTSIPDAFIHKQSWQFRTSLLYVEALAEYHTYSHFTSIIYCFYCVQQQLHVHAKHFTIQTYSFLTLNYLCFINIISPIHVFLNDLLKNKNLICIFPALYETVLHFPCLLSCFILGPRDT